MIQHKVIVHNIFQHIICYFSLPEHIFDIFFYGPVFGGPGKLRIQVLGRTSVLDNGYLPGCNRSKLIVPCITLHFRLFTLKDLFLHLFEGASLPRCKYLLEEIKEQLALSSFTFTLLLFRPFYNSLSPVFQTINLIPARCLCFFAVPLLL